VGTPAGAIKVPKEPARTSYLKIPEKKTEGQNKKEKGPNETVRKRCKGARAMKRAAGSLHINLGKTAGAYAGECSASSRKEREEKENHHVNGSEQKEKDRRWKAGT